jgi:hypothetical protein
MNLTPYIIAWSVLAIVVVALALMRKNVVAHEDDSIHLGGGAAVINEQQATVAKRLASIERWGKICTALLVAGGLVLGGYYGLSLWEQTSRAGFR